MQQTSGSSFCCCGGDDDEGFLVGSFLSLSPFFLSGCGDGGAVVVVVVCCLFMGHDRYSKSLGLIVRWFGRVLIWGGGSDRPVIGQIYWVPLFFKKGLGGAHGLRLADEELKHQWFMLMSGNRSNARTTHTIHLNTEKMLVTSSNGTPSHLLKHIPSWIKIQRCTRYQIKNLILTFYFGCCCFPSYHLSSSSNVCIPVCGPLDSNALVGTLCCNIAPCGSPCIAGICGCWVVVCCRKNNKWGEEMFLLVWVRLLLMIYLLVCPVFSDL